MGLTGGWGGGRLDEGKARRKTPHVDYPDSLVRYILGLANTSEHET